MSDFSLYPDAEIVYEMILRYSHSCSAVCVYSYLAVRLSTFTFVSLNGTCTLFKMLLKFNLGKCSKMSVLTK